MYGVMLNAKTDIWVKEPPVNASKKLNASPVWLAKKFWMYVGSTPGVGSSDPSLTTISIKNVKNSLCLISST